MIRHTFHAGLFATVMLTARIAAADDVAWKPEWRRFDWKEGVATGGLIVTSYLEDRYLEGPSSPRWTGALLFDNAVRGVLRGDNHLQRAVTKYADVEYTMLTLYPYFDVGIALAIHRSPGDRRRGRVLVGVRIVVWNDVVVRRDRALLHPKEPKGETRGLRASRAGSSRRSPDGFGVVVLAK